MSSNCLYMKQLDESCKDGIRKYKINVIAPSKGDGVCRYNLKDVKDGDIVEEACDNTACPLPEFNAGRTDFKATLSCMIDSFNETFAKDFSGGPGDCSQDKVVKQSAKLVVGPDADLTDCKIELDQKIDLSSQKICGNINETLAGFEGEAKSTFINSLLDKVISRQPKNIKDKTQFISRFKTLMVDNLMAVQGGVNSKCSQTISISQDQNIYFLGNISCKGSTFKFSQEAIVNAYMSCITAPVLDVISNDTLLKRYFTEKQNADCIYDFELLEPCNNNKRKLKVNILSPAKGTGKCTYTNNQIIQEDCTTNSCKVSEWSEWSPCLVDEKHHRTRRITLQGKDCPPLYQEEDCFYEEERDRPNANPLPVKRKNLSSRQSGFYRFFSEGPSVLEFKQKILFYAFIIFFFIVLFYTIFF